MELLGSFRFSPDLPLYRNNIWMAVREGHAELARALRRGMWLPFHGHIDCVVIFDRCLTPRDVRDLYAELRAEGRKTRSQSWRK